MSRGRYLSLEEARKHGTLDRFCKEHPNTTNGSRFRTLLSAMSRGRREDAGTSAPASSEGYSDTQIRRDTSEDSER
jgi:hypothetical protein